MKHAPEPLLQPVMKFKWIQGGSLGSQFRFGFRRDMVAFQKPVTGSLGLIVLAFDFRPVTTFGLQLRTRQKEVVQRLPDLPIQLVERVGAYPKVCVWVIT